MYNYYSDKIRILISPNNDLKEILVAYFQDTIYEYDTINYLI